MKKSTDCNLPRNDLTIEGLPDSHKANNSAVETLSNGFNQPDSVLSNSALEIQRLQQQLRLQRRLRKVEQRLRRSLNLSTVLGATAVETAALFQAEQVSLLRYHSQTQSWQPVARYCQNQSLAWQQTFATAYADFPQMVGQLQQRKPLWIFAGQPSSPLTAERQKWLLRWPGRCLLIPIQDRRNDYWATPDNCSDEHWGIMVIASPGLEMHLDSAITAAQSIALELELAMVQCHQYQELLTANRELQHLALEDGLTRLANRRCFDEQLTDEWYRLARERQPLSLILCDLDNFKRYNDAFGHPAGDRCLIRVARALLNGPQRPADLVARYGGEEFAIILPNTNTQGAWRIAQKIHNNVRALKIAHAPGNEEARVTVTMGLSTLVPHHGSSAQVLVKAADIALYHAKQQGRNRTYISAQYNTIAPGTVTHSVSASELPLAIAPPADQPAS